MAVTFVVDDTLINGINKLRLFAENPKNWRWLTNGRLELTEISHLIKSGDVEAAYAVVVTTDYMCRHLSLRLRGIDVARGRMSGVPVEMAFTLANLLGYTGCKTTPSGVVTEPGKEWVVGTNPSDGALIIQQKVKSVAQA